MKKILFPLLGLSAILSACDMELTPPASLPEKEAMTSFENMSYYRNYIYATLRGNTAGSNITTAALQGDEFIGVIINGNRMGGVNNGQIFSNSGDITAFFGGRYGNISTANYFFPYAEAMLNSEMDSEDERAELERYVAEAKFLRAYCYWYLVDHYCVNYTTTNGDTPALGMPIVTVYNPTPYTSDYVGRSTLNEVYNLIESDLNDAYAGLVKYEEAYPEVAENEMLCQNAAYLSSYAVRALQARVALLKGDWQTAYDYANEIISSNLYSLSTRARYTTYWSTDKGPENIFLPYGDKDEQAAVPATGGAFLASVEDRLDYIPTQNAMDIYTDENDIRRTAFFASRTITVYGSYVEVPAFVKFPGNPELNLVASSNALKNLPKPFRLSEQYLILAEAADNLDMVSEANAAIKKIRENRISRYRQPDDYTGDDLTHEIRLERQRELIGEGFRISDLRRWHQGFSRDVNYQEYPEAADVTVVAGRGVTYTADDYRYTWPLPSSEFQINPQLKGQQNPGY